MPKSGISVLSNSRVVPTNALTVTSLLVNLFKNEDLPTFVTPSISAFFH